VTRPSLDLDDEGFDELDRSWLRSRSAWKWAVVDDDVLPAWVADMDFPTPPVVRRALMAVGQEADLGYPTWWAGIAPQLEAAFLARMDARYGWQPAPGLLRTFTDVHQGVQAALHVATQAGDGVALLTPSYPPFLDTLRQLDRVLHPIPIVARDAGWTVDLDAAADAARHSRALLLVNPHNPTGHVLTGVELAALAGLAEEHDLLVIADEIHADLVLPALPGAGGPGPRHRPFASVSDDAANRTVTLTSASKGFNLPGLCAAVGHVGAARVRSGLDALPSQLMGRVGVPNVAGLLAAWTPEAAAWLDRCLVRLATNRDIVARRSVTDLGGTRFLPPDATYLAWLDFRPAGLGADPAAWLLEHARVMLSSGPEFGPSGEGFARLNFATSGHLLTEILDRIAVALAAR
jgi:cystathionine beta-lyase